jgi:hypothetical protein
VWTIVIYLQELKQIQERAANQILAYSDRSEALAAELEAGQVCYRAVVVESTSYCPLYSLAVFTRWRRMLASLPAAVVAS